MADGSALSASLVLDRGPTGQVGARRIALLTAIAEQGSISAAARTLGLSYKGAWDGVQALNNLFERPLVLARAGGRRGGNAKRAVLRD
jgi:molybdate transport system regulatory protein